MPRQLVSRYTVKMHPELQNPFPKHGQQPATWKPQNVRTLVTQELPRPAEPVESFPNTERAGWKPNGGSISMLANYKKSTQVCFTKEMKLVSSVYTNPSHVKRALALQIGNDKVFAPVYAHYNRKTEQWDPKCIFDLEKPTESDMYNVKQIGNELFVERNGHWEKAIIIQ